MAYNKAILIGRMTATPEIKTTKSGKYVTSFTIAVDRYVKDREKTADFITVIAWEKRAEFVSRYFAKGDEIGIEGSIVTRNYEDSHGNKRTAVEVLSEKIFFVGGKRSSNDAPASNEPPADFEETDEDLPF